jgi:hypothetical protein
MTPQDHNKTLGITHLAYGGFHLLLMLFVSLLLLFVMAFPQRGGSGIDAFTIMMFVIFAFGILFTLPSLIAAYALLKRKPWARTAAIIAGVLATPSFPYGTALGVYTLWFMFGDEGKSLYTNNAGAWPSTAQLGALPGANPAGTWTSAEPHKQRERERVPPPEMPNWR